MNKTELDPTLAGRTRASIVFAGPMLARMGAVTLPLPGGDVIGGRPLDTHLQALEVAGRRRWRRNRVGEFDMHVTDLHGAGYLLLAEASVTATENAIMAAVLAKGETIIDNAASEPHVRDLCHFLNELGAQIEGIGTNRLQINGVERLSGGEYRIGADFMEVGSFIGATAVTGGEVRIKNADPQNLGMVRIVYEKLGVHWVDDGNDIVIPAAQPHAYRIGRRRAYPADQAYALAGLPARFDEYRRRHCHAVRRARFCCTTGCTKAASSSSTIWSSWARVSCFAIRIACWCRERADSMPARKACPAPISAPAWPWFLPRLCAEGTSVIHNIQQIDRGYESIDAKLQSLGAQIERAPD